MTWTYYTFPSISVEDLDRVLDHPNPLWFNLLDLSSCLCSELCLRCRNPNYFEGSWIRFPSSMWHRDPALKPWDPSLWTPIKTPVDRMAHTVAQELGSRLGGEFRLVGCEINIMPPGACIQEHVDAHDLVGSIRVHVVIKTNAQALISCADDTRHWTRGSVFVFNNQRPHSVVNGGITDRAHLVMDFLNVLT